MLFNVVFTNETTSRNENVGKHFVNYNLQIKGVAKKHQHHQ